jgi:hypothetical protein
MMERIANARAIAFTGLIPAVVAASPPDESIRQITSGIDVDRRVSDAWRADRLCRIVDRENRSRCRQAMGQAGNEKSLQHVSGA